MTVARTTHPPSMMRGRIGSTPDTRIMKLRPSANSHVPLAMRSTVHDHKVFDSVVSLVTVNVVDMFLVHEFPAKVALHYEPMFVNNITRVGPHQYVPSGSNVPSTIPSRVVGSSEGVTTTLTGTVLSLSLKCLELLATVLAGMLMPHGSLILPCHGRGCVSSARPLHFPQVYRKNETVPD